MKVRLFLLAGFFIVLNSFSAQNSSVSCQVSKDDQSGSYKQQEVVGSTFAMIKPDAVADGYTGQILDLIEKNGFSVVQMKKMTFSKELASDFYAVHKERPFYQDLVSFITSGPVVVLELSKINAVADWRQLIGATNPADAAMGTIRKMFGVSKSCNAIHGSDSVENAALELALVFFK